MKDEDIDKMVGKEPKPQRISELVEGEKLFDSQGFSLVKTTKQGIEKMIELPIKSTGVSEYMEELEGKAPRPPVVKRVIKKGSKEGKELGLGHDKMLQVFDETDETYVDALNQHSQDFSWRVCIFALDLKWTKKDKSEGKSFEEKKEILKSNGITYHHTNQILKDVQSLTRIQEDGEDFLSEN